MDSGSFFKASKGAELDKGGPPGISFLLLGGLLASCGFDATLFANELSEASEDTSGSSSVISSITNPPLPVRERRTQVQLT